MAVAALQMKGRIWDIVEKQLKEKSKVSRRQAVVSLGVLGLRNKHVFFTLLEMLELDGSPEVRIQRMWQSLEDPPETPRYQKRLGASGLSALLRPCSLGVACCDL
ncbi:protein HEATR9 isoform X2 [Emydura macquarii macquarii]|uniref:protein HEATR9 isoform X2 n=1 Tax=Emydura macquarii macquarii TaxID=1129001 RepID=UPI00352AA4C4